MDDDLEADSSAGQRRKKAAWLRAVYERNLAQCRAADTADAPALARKAHTAMDAQLQRDSVSVPEGKPIRCGRGCSHCCHGPVEIWPQEAALLAQFVRDAGLRPDLARLERQSHYTVETWREQAVADQACVFLDHEGACSVYAARPNTCRKLLVMSDPACCDVQQGRTDEIDRWFSWEAEMMEVAALEVFGMALLPRLLLPALQQK
ncbi:MAG: YkgJ family cysteine cluster protein [Burkholderiales bacterium]|nr:YkgJ family cysteine cluster protein [Burkholderiales bacterium]